MMREIKFRAWLGDEQGMLNWDGVRKLHLATIAGCKHPMQYTGLKDKNGVEIYEGDIVNGVSGCGVVDYSKRGTKFGIHTTKGHYITNEPVSKYYSLIGCEIIGNIYENPELIKEGKE